MATSEKIDEIVSQKAIDGFVMLADNVHKTIEAIEKLIATGVDVNKALGGANSFKGVNDQTTKMTENQKQLAAQSKQLQAAQEKLNIANSDQAKQLAALKVQQQAAVAANKDQAKEALGLVDAYAKLEKQYIASARQTQNLTIQYGKNNEQAKQAAASTKVLYEQLITADAAVGKFGRNVGNYPTTFQSLGDIGKNSLDKINNGFTNVLKNIAATAVAFIGIRGIVEFGKESVEAFERSESQSKRLENTLKNLGASAKDIEILKSSIISLSAAFPYLTRADLTEVQQKLITYGKLTAEQIKELTPTILNFAANQRIGIAEATDVITKALEGNSRGLKSYGINIKDAGDETGRFNLIQDELGRRVANAGNVFADTSEGKVAIYQKRLIELKQSIGEQLFPIYAEFLSGSIKVINVIKQIDFANVVKGIGALAATWLIYRTAVLASNVATAFNTAAQIANKAASLGSTVAVAAETIAEETNGKVKNSNIIITYALIAAQRVYNATVAALSGPFGIILALVGLLTIGVASFASSMSKSADDMQRMKVQAAATKEVMEKANSVFAEQTVVIDTLVKTINDHTLSDKERAKALKELIALDPDHLKGLTLANAATEEGIRIINAYIDALHKKAIEEAAAEIGKQDQIEKTKAQIKLQQENIDFEKQLGGVIKETSKIIDENAKDYSGRQGAYKALDASKTLDDFKSNHKKLVDELSATIKDVDNRQKTLDDIIQKNASAATFKQKSGLGTGLHTKEADTTDADEARRQAEELNKYLIELDDKLAKAKREHAAEALKEIGADAKAVADDEKNGLDKRLQAYDIFAQTQAAIINRNSENEIAQQQKILDRIAEIKKKDPNNLTQEEDKVRHQEELVTQTIINLQQKREDAILNLAHTSEKNRLDIIKSSQDKETRLRLDTYNLEKSKAQSAYSIELTDLEDSYQKKYKAAGNDVKQQELITKQFNDAKIVLQDKYIIAALKKDIEFAEAELAIQQAVGIDVTKEITKLNDLKLKLKEAETKFLIDQNKLQVDDEKNKYDKINSFLQKAKSDSEQVLGIIGGFIKASITSQKNALKDQSDIIDANTQKQIDAENATADSAQVKADRIAKINAKAQAQKDAIAQRQKQLDIQQAQFDKAKGIAEIIINTAIAVTKFLAKGDIPEAIGAGVIGAAELAIAIATPIPHFEHGTLDAPGGESLVGEKRSELIVHPDGSMEVTPNVPTVMNIPAHSMVFPDARAAMEAGIGGGLPAMIQASFDVSGLRSDIKQLIKVVDSKEAVQFKKGKNGWEKIKGNGRTNYLNDNLQ